MRTLSLLFFLFAFLSCSNNDITENLTWLAELNSSCPSDGCWLPRYTLRTEYQGQEVFYFSYEPPLCDIAYSRILLSASGDTLIVYPPNEVRKFLKEVPRGEIIHTCSI